MSEERKLKLIWDFRGPDAATTARHHAIHLKEFLKTHQLSLNIIGTEQLSPTHAIAFMVVMDGEMRPVRDALKPHRGQIFDPEA